MYNIKLNSFSFSKYSNIIVNEISGLCPPGATISTTKMGKDGTQYQGSTKNERNIVINFSIINNVKETRKTMYKEIVVGDKTTVTIDNLTTDGYIETFELNNFQNITTGQISIICPSSYFYGEEKTISLASFVKFFNSEMKNDYVIQVTFSGDVNNFTYMLNETDYTINYSFISGDTLTIDSYNRKIYINGKNKYSTKGWIKWGLIKKGKNSITHYSENCVANFIYQDRYLGI